MWKLTIALGSFVITGPGDYTPPKGPFDTLGQCVAAGVEFALKLEQGVEKGKGKLTIICDGEQSLSLNGNYIQLRPSK